MAGKSCHDTADNQHQGSQHDAALQQMQILSHLGLEIKQVTFYKVLQSLDCGVRLTLFISILLAPYC